MTCDDVSAKVPLFVTGDLPADEAAAVRAHLLGCPACAADRDELQAVRALLDVPVAAPPVDVGAIYRAAFDRQARSTRRWRLAACAGAVVAAGVLFVALVPRLEVKATDSEFVVRWGESDGRAELGRSPEPLPAPLTDPSVLARVAELEGRPVADPAQRKRLAELEDLLLTLAADADARDAKARAELAVVAAEVRRLRTETTAQFQQTEKTHAAFYAAIFDKPRPGGQP